MKFTEYIERAGRRVGRANAFCDFLTFAVCALSMQRKEDEYLQVAKRYNSEEMQLFSNAFGCMVHDMDNRAEGLKDCLGDYFMDILSSDRKGQFFTPEPVCDLMVRLNNEYKDGQTVSDPACGSGRLFLSTAKINRKLFFWGCDIDLQCCQMTLINMCLNGLRGFVSHMDTLKAVEWKRWVIEFHPIAGVPYIREINFETDIETAEFSEVETVEVVKEIPPAVTIEPQLELLFENVDLF